MTAPSDAGTPRSAARRSELGPVVRRGWLPLVLGLVIGIAGGLLAHAVITTRYTASASVVVTPTGVQDSPLLAGGRTNSDVINMDTEVQLVTSDNVANRVKQLVPSTATTSIPDLIKPVSVTVAANTEVMTIAYKADTAAAAARLANAFASAYLQQRQADAQAILTQQLNKITPQAAALSAQLKTLSDQLDTLKAKAPQISFVRAQVASLKGRVNALNNKISTLSTTVVTPGRIRSTATPGTATASPSRLLFVAAGAAIGLLLGLLFAWLRVAVRRRLRDADDVRSVLDLPVLATVAGGADLATDSPSFQDYRRIANVVAATGTAESKTVLITGQRAGTTGAVASNLLRAFRLLSVRTALMPTSRATAVTVGTDRTVREAVVPAPRHGVFGAEALAEARGSGYLIVVATDPRIAADAQTIARFSDVIVIVIDKGTRARVAREVLDQLDAVGAPVLGVVIVRSRTFMNRHRGTATSFGAPVADGDSERPEEVAPARNLPNDPAQRTNTGSSRRPAASPATRRKQ